MTPFRPVQGEGHPIDKRMLYQDLIDYFQPGGRNQVIAGRVTAKDDAQPASETPLAALQSLYDAFAEKQAAGRPLLHCDRYRIAGNPRFRIVGGGEATVCWAYLDRSQDWLREVAEAPGLARQTRLDLALGRGDHFQRFPHYRTFGEEGEHGELIDLTAPQVNALAHLTAWSVCTEANTLASQLGLPLPTGGCAGAP